jgi:outer membrane protein assembly factor BamB
LWRVTHGGMNASSRPVFGQDRFYLTSGYGNLLLAVQPDGNIDWKYSVGKSVPTRSSLLLVGDLMFMVSDDGFASCVEIAKKEATRLTQMRLGGLFFASPLLVDGKIYFCESEKGSTFVVEATRDMKLLATNKLDEGCMASPIAIGKSLYLRTRTHLYRIEAKE